MSPEMVGGRGYGHQTDMWSMGMLCYHTLYGHGPFSATCQADLEEMILRAPISPGTQ